MTSTTTFLAHERTGIPHYSRVSGLALLDPRLGAAAVRLLAVIGLYANRAGIAHIDQARLAAILGLSDNPKTHRPALSKATAELESAGYLERLKHTGFNCPKRYRLTVPADSATRELRLPTPSSTSSVLRAAETPELNPGDDGYSGPLPCDDELSADERIWVLPNGDWLSYPDALKDYNSGPDLWLYGERVYAFFELTH